MKTFAKLTIAAVLLTTNCAYAGFKEHYDLGQQYLSNFQYSGAVTEFKNALRINYMDNSARIGLINSYISRATYYANKEHNYQKAADDYRSALFYMQYYPEKNSSMPYVPQITANLNTCLKNTGFDISAQNRFATAKQLRAEGNFSAAGYEFNQTLADRNLQKESFEQVGDIMKLLGNKQKAAEYYRRALAVSPSDIHLRLSYAKMLDELGQEAAAVKEYNYVLAKITDDKDLLYSLERIYKKKLEKNPTDADLTANLGAILQKQGKFDEALSYYHKAESIDPSNINTRLNVGTLYQQKGDNRTAIKAYDSVLILYPDNINANLYKAKANEALGDTKAALDGYKKVVALDPANIEARSQMLNLLKGTMTTAQFVDYVKKNMADANPSELLYTYAVDLHKQNKLTEAVTMYNEALKLNGTNPEIFINLAIAQNQAGNPDTALVTLKNAALKFPDNKQIKEAIASVTQDSINKKLANAAAFVEKKDYKNAIAEYEKITPPNVASLTGIASVYQAMNKSDTAIEYYEEALKLKPADSELAYYIGILYAEKEDYENAKVYVNRAIAINKNNQKAIDFAKSLEEQTNMIALNQAIDLYDAKKFDEALPILNNLITSDNKNSYAYYYRGMIYDENSKRKEAIEDFKKAYELNNEFVIANYLIASDYDAMEKYKDAYSYYEKYASSGAPDDEYKQYAAARAEELKQYAK